MSWRFVLSGLIVLVSIAYLALRRGVTWRGLAVVAVTVAVLAGVGLELERGLDPDDYPEVAEIEATLSNGQPTMVEFYRDD